MLDEESRRLFVLDTEIPAIVEVDPGTGHSRVFSGRHAGEGPGFIDPIDIALDVPRNRLLLLESGFYNAVIAVDLESGYRTVLSEPGDGNGVGFSSNATAIAIDGEHDRALVIDRANDAVRTVSLESGERGTLSSPFNPGPTFVGPSGITVDTVNQRALVIDAALQALIGVDLESGDRTLLSGEDNDGEVLSHAWRVVLDPTDAGRALISGPGRGVVAVDLGSGDRTLLTGIHDPSALAADSVNGIVYINSYIMTGLMTVDPSTGEAMLLANGLSGSGTYRFFGSGGMAFHAGSRRIILPNGNRAILGVDAITGDRILISTGYSADLGAVMNDPTAVLFDALSDRLLVVDGIFLGSRALLEINIHDGFRTVLSSDEVGEGAPFSTPTYLAPDWIETRVLVVDNDSETPVIVAVDLDTGDRQILSGNDFHEPALLSPSGIAVDANGGRALVADRGGSEDDARVLAVNLTNGVRTVLTDPDIDAHGPELLSPTGVLLDAAQSRLLVADRLFRGIIAVDLETGTRSVVSGPDVGAGLHFSDPQDLVADFTRNLLYVYDRATRALVVVELESGARATISR